MADGVAITAGAGTTVATDDAGASGHVQVFKLAISSNGSATVVPADATNGLSVDVKQVATGTNTIGGVIPKTTTSGGLSIFRSLDLDETEEDIKTSAGQLYGWYIYNDAAAAVYVKVYNLTAASTTVGSSTPVLTIPIPATSAANVFNVHGIAFGTAICAAATTGVADSSTAAPAANQVVANFFYA